MGFALLRNKPNAHFTATYRPSDPTHSKRLSIVQHGATPICADLSNPKHLLKLLPLAQRIVWMAPPNTHTPIDTTLKKLILYSAARTQNKKSSPTTITYISTTGVYGNTQGQWINEHTPICPHTARAKRRAQAEQHLKTGLRHGVRIHIVRAPGIYSAKRLPIQRIQAGTPALLPEEDSWSNHIHEQDLARLSLWVNYKGGAYCLVNACDKHPSKMGDYFDLIADAHKLPRPTRLPASEVKQQVSATLWSFMTESRRIESLNQKKLGFKLNYESVGDFIRNNQHGRRQ